jgi:spermidine/putrescine-binding protein
MKQIDFNRRLFLQGLAATAGGVAAAGIAPAKAAGPTIRLWSAPIMRPFPTWEPFEQQAGITIAWSPKSASADEALSKMMVGDGKKLYDAFTDNGGGMEDAMAENGVIAELDTSRMKNWGLLRDEVRDPNGAAAHSIRYNDKIFAVPYIANADSLAYNKTVLGQDYDSWAPLFDPEFKGKVAMQNDFGPTMTVTAIYLHESGQMNIKDRSNMTKDEVQGVAEYLIEKKKGGQFRTFWNGFQQGVDLLASGEVVMMSCWEPIQRVAAGKASQDIVYGTMKEGHQVWNNVVMLTKDAAKRGVDEAFYKLADTCLSPWYTTRQLSRFGFASLTTGMVDYLEAHPADFNVADLKATLKSKEQRYAVKGNAWQNVYPKELRAYQEWWSRVQAA